MSFEFLDGLPLDKIVSLCYKCINTTNTLAKGESCLFSLNYRDPRPIYEQLKEMIRRMILTGVIATDEKLPSVRELAAELSVNPNTIQRAYRDLEAEGFVYTVSNKGSFAAELTQVDDSRVRTLKERFCSSAGELLKLGMTKEELIRLIEEENHD